jgi:hypothetical protein
MAVIFRPSADEHDIPHDEALYAMLHGARFEDFEDPRPPHGPATLWIGPSRFGTLEVIAEVSPPRDLEVFHVMNLRPGTAEKVGYQQ